MSNVKKTNKQVKCKPGFNRSILEVLLGIKKNVKLYDNCVIDESNIAHTTGQK